MKFNNQDVRRLLVEDHVPVEAMPRMAMAFIVLRGWWFRSSESAYWWLASLIPKWLVRMAVLRAGVDASTGSLRYRCVTDITLMEVYDTLK